MKLLSLMRHASAAMDGMDDHSRALTAGGQTEAVDIATRFVMSGITPPNLILSSDSLRTQRTAETLHQFFPEALVQSDRALYLASAESLMDVIHTFDDIHAHIVVVAHNPGIGQLAFDLGGSDHPDIARGFAPATLVTFECDIALWCDLRGAHATLKNVIAP